MYLWPHIEQANLYNGIANITTQSIFRQIHHDVEYQAIFALPDWVRERHHAMAWDQTANFIVLGLICVWSIISRAGGVTLATGRVPPVLAQPLETGGGGFVAAVTTAVGTEDAKLLPSAFFACTLKRIVLPTSTALSR